MQRQHPRIRVTWFGPCEESFAWLFSRISNNALVTISGATSSTTQICDACDQGTDRLVLACANRISYPEQTLQFLAERFPEVPVAVALGSWWDGAGRTGLQSRSCLTLPWHRWWDGWSQWLGGSDPALFGFSPTQFCHTGQPTIEEPKTQVVPALPSGIVVANGRPTADSWRFCAQSLGSHATTVCLSEFFELAVPDGAPAPGWILWDDSCLDTFAGADEVTQCKQFFSVARERYPHAALCAAFSLPRWTVWRQAMLSGADEILAKPNSGAALGKAIAARRSTDCR